jgi:hypothetical protein
MNPPFRLITPDRLQIREGGGCMSIFGLPFFAGGIFLFLTLLGIVPMRNADDLPTLVWPLLVVMAVAFTTVGGALVFGRAWTVVDRQQREVSKQWGLLVPLRERATPIDGYTIVRLGFVEGDSDTADKYPVSLRAPGSADLVLWNATAYEQARAYAKALAELLRFDVEDASTDHAVRVAPGEFDVPLQQRIRQQPELRSDVARPANMRSRITRDMDAVTIVIPLRRTHWLWLAAGLIPLTVLVYIGPAFARFFEQSRTPDPVSWIFLGFLTLFFGVLPMGTMLNGFLRSRRGATVVVLSRSGVRISERGAWSTRTVASLDASEILDVDYSTRGGLTIKTRKGLHSFGKGLDDEEIRYVHSLVTSTLIGSSA